MLCSFGTGPLLSSFMNFARKGGSSDCAEAEDEESSSASSCEFRA